MDVVITGIGLRSALGDLAQTWSQLLAGQSGIRVAQPFDALPPLPLGLVEATPQRDLRPLTEMILAAALQDADLTGPLPDCGVVIGSSRGNQTRLEQCLNGEIDGADWLGALPNTAAVTVAHRIKTQSIVLAPMGACATGISAIAQGAELIVRGQCDRVIAGAVETPLTPLTLAGFRKMGALAATGCYPFDQAREGFVLGEGGAIFVLESPAVAVARGAQVYGRIAGFGLSADAYHLSAPDPTGMGAQVAIWRSLKLAEISPQAIDFVHAHGTATQMNDQIEAAVLRDLFPQGPRVVSTKGATGHTLGGSSAIGVAICLMALQQQRVPPCVGLRQTTFDLNIMRSAQAANLRYVLCNGFGFGGQNGAIVMQRAS